MRASTIQHDKEVHMKSRQHLVLAVLAVAIPAVYACTAIAPDDTGATASSSPAAGTSQTTQALSGAQKICSAISPNNWRDSIEVNNGWAIAVCRSWTQSVGASQWQLGCVSDTGFSWGATNGGLPSPNCGWACAANFGSPCTGICPPCGKIGPGMFDCTGTCILDPCIDICF
jgi:hypothetical protein